MRGSSIKKAADQAATAELAGRRILVIEDSPVVAPYTVDVLTELGFTVIGPAPNMASARELIEAEPVDGALVDIHIRGERVFPLCDLLEAKKVPFVLTSGYADWAVPEKWADRPRLLKPYTLDQVEEVMRDLLGSRR